jgi:hypothetical protein
MVQPIFGGYMKIILVTVLTLFAPQAYAMEFLKCNSIEGKTLWASFSQRYTSGTKEKIHFPSDITILSSVDTLQDRIIYSSSEGRKILVNVSPTAISFAFPAKGPEGKIQTEEFELRLYSPKNLSAFVGSWRSIDVDGNVRTVQAFCSAY